MFNDVLYLQEPVAWTGYNGMNASRRYTRDAPEKYLCKTKNIFQAHSKEWPERLHKNVSAYSDGDGIKLHYRRNQSKGEKA